MLLVGSLFRERDQPGGLCSTREYGIVLLTTACMLLSVYVADITAALLEIYV